MSKLTAEKCRELLAERYRQRDSGDISIGGIYTLQALEIALPMLEQQGGWISCSERMPEEGVEVITTDGINVGAGYYFMDDGLAIWNYTGSMSPGGVETHWQPMPLPPQPQSTTPQIDNDGGAKC